MRRTLIRHPDFPCQALSGLEVEAARPEPQRLVVRYRLLDANGMLAFPPASGGRQDGLWKHTCLEAFVAAAGRGYRELNLSPGGAWAAYRFEGRRQGMAQAGIGPPAVERDGGSGFLAAWDLDLPPDAPWRVGVAAVIEEAGGRLSYWALRHPAGQPDFHDPDCFVLELPAPEGP